MIDFHELKFDKNTMYQYAMLVSGNNKYLKTTGEIMVRGIPFHVNIILIWFVFWYLLECETLEDAMKVYKENQKEIDGTYKIHILLKRNSMIFPRSMRQDTKIGYVLGIFYDFEAGLNRYRKLILDSGLYAVEEEPPEELAELQISAFMVE